MSEPKSGRGALAAGGLAAILASACCLGPLILVLLGFSGAWIANLAVLEPYRPIFIGAALMALFSPGAASSGRFTPASRMRSAPCPRADGLQDHFLDRGRAGLDCPRFSVRPAVVLLRGIHREETCHRYCPGRYPGRSGVGRHQDRHTVGARYDLRVVSDHGQDGPVQGGRGPEDRGQL